VFGQLTLTKAVEQARSSVLKVTCRDSSGRPLLTGTGFFVNNTGVVVTAKHVITLPNGSVCPDVTLSLPLEHLSQPVSNIRLIESFADVHVAVSATDSVHDIAVLTSTENPLDKRHDHLTIGTGREGPIVANVLPRSFATLDARPLEAGDGIFVCGYPLEFPVLITTSGNVASSDALDDDINNRALKDVYWADIQINHGNSGGPVFSRAKGRVVGIVTAVQLADAEFGDPFPPPAYGIEEPASAASRAPVIHPIR